MNDPDPGPARRRVHVGLGPLSGVHARRGRPGRLRTAGGNGSLRVDRRQGVRGKRDDHPAQEAHQRRTERNREGGEQERQQDPPGRKSAPSPTSSPGESTRTPLQEIPGNIRADHHRGTRTLFLQDHPLNNPPGL